MEGEGTVIGKKAPDFTLPDHMGKPFALRQALSEGPLLLVFYPGDFTMVCTKQMCSYRDHLEAFRELGTNIVGISHNSRKDHQEFSKKYDFQFKLLTDDQQRVAKLYDCTSLLMLGRVSRAVFIVNQKGLILYRYVEPTTLSHRSAHELLGILRDLRHNNLL